MATVRSDLIIPEVFTPYLIEATTQTDSFLQSGVVQPLAELNLSSERGGDFVKIPFYKANLTGEIPHTIRSFPNILGFLGETKGGDPVPLRSNEVSRMLGKVDELSMEGENIAIPFTIGENIKVIDGPFNGFNGTIEKVNEEKRKLEVMVKIFGRKTPLELSYMQVEKV